MFKKGKLSDMHPFSRNLLLLITTAFGIVFLYLSLAQSSRLINNFSAGYESQNWGSVTGKITNSVARGSYVPAKRSEKFISYIKYEYSVDNHIYTSETVAFVTEYFVDSESAKNRAANYPVGRQVSVFYNPLSPNSSCLVPGFFLWENLAAVPFVIIFLLASLCFTIIPLGLMLGFIQSSPP